MSRVRGLLLERTRGDEGILLTPDGRFVQARVRGGVEPLPGMEVWAEEQRRSLWVGMSEWLRPWPRMAAATAVAFAGVGALFAAVYLRSDAPSVQPQERMQLVVPMLGEGTAFAERSPARAFATEAPRAPATAVPTIRLSEEIQAPRLGAPAEFGGWGRVTVRTENPDAPSAGSVVEHLRRAFRSLPALSEGTGPTEQSPSSRRVPLKETSSVSSGSSVALQDQRISAAAPGAGAQSSRQSAPSLQPVGGAGY